MKDKYRGINKWNNLYVYFFVNQVLFFVTPTFARLPLLIPLDITTALQTHAFAMCAFTVGYLFSVLINVPTQKTRLQKLRAQEEQVRKEQEPQWIFKPQFFTGTYALMFFGISIVILQIAVVQSPLAYLRGLLGGEFNVQVRDAFLLSSEQGGIKGIFKIFGMVPLSAYLFSLGLPHFVNLTPGDQKKFSKLNAVALCLTAVKVLFSLDRLTIVMVIVANIFMTVRTRRNLKIKISLVMLFALLIEFVSRRRQQEIGALDFIISYYNLGIINLQIMIDTVQSHTYGFVSIFAPLTFIYSPGFEFKTHEFYFADAQYLAGYVYQDFGTYFPLFYAALGYFYRTIDRKVLHEKNIYYSSVYFLIIGLTMTFAAVPAATGVDFWLGILVPLFLVKLYVRRAHPVASDSHAPIAPRSRAPHLAARRFQPRNLS